MLAGCYGNTASPLTLVGSAILCSCKRQSSPSGHETASVAPFLCS